MGWMKNAPTSGANAATPASTEENDPGLVIGIVNASDREGVEQGREALGFVPSHHHYILHLRLSEDLHHFSSTEDVPSISLGLLVPCATTGRRLTRWRMSYRRSSSAPGARRHRALTRPWSNGPGSAQRRC